MSGQRGLPVDVLVEMHVLLAAAVRLGSGRGIVARGGGGRGGGVVVGVGGVGVDV